jgi:hypothetical protein
MCMYATWFLAVDIRQFAIANILVIMFLAPKLVVYAVGETLRAHHIRPSYIDLYVISTQPSKT